MNLTLRDFRKGFDVVSIKRKMLEYLDAGEQSEAPVIHHLSPGIYTREMHIKKGTMILGHKHRFKHQIILLKGAMNIIHENGTYSELRAPIFFIAEPGQKLGYAVEDTVWLNIHNTDLTDIAEIERYLAEDYDSYKPLMLALENRSADIDSFKKLPHAHMNEFYNNLEVSQVNEIGMRFRKGESRIHGVGLFATSPIKRGETVLSSLGTKVDRHFLFVNHSIEPSCKFFNGTLLAARDISGAKGSLNGEELTIDYRTLLGDTRWDLPYQPS